MMSGDGTQTGAPRNKNESRVKKWRDTWATLQYRGANVVVQGGKWEPRDEFARQKRCNKGERGSRKRLFMWERLFAAST